MSTPPPRVFTGWVSCATGREQLVMVPEDVIALLVAGGVPCPACSSPCKPGYRETTVNADTNGVAWREGGWQPNLFLAEGGWLPRLP